ncbi:MAG: hypothetical protein U0V70_05280 [Terriglobia bacterium]
MTRTEMLSTIFISSTMALLFTVVFSCSVLAEGSSGDYNLLVASGFVCDPSDSSACPAVAQAANGEIIEISGAGMMNPSSKTITAMGAFTHKTAKWEILETGIWKATEVMKFNSYGIAPGALLRDARRFKSSGLLPRGLLTGPMPAGGLVLLRIQLLPDTGKPKEAILQVNCAIGKVPENQQGDGIRLAVEGEELKFDQKVSGRTLFILRKSLASAPLKVSPPGR